MITGILMEAIALTIKNPKQFPESSVRYLHQ